MTDEKEKLGTPLPLGKKWRNDHFATEKTPEQVQEQTDIDKEYDAPEAIPLSVYFMNKGIRDQVVQAAMTAYTKVRRATAAVFDEIFETF